MKIVVIQQKMIGDVLISSILCENLKLAYPDSQIDYIIYDSTKAVIEGMNFIDNVILFSKKERESKWQLLKFILKIRREKYDIIIDPYSKLESWLLVFFSNAKRTISFSKKGRNFIYTDLVERKEDYDSNLGTIIEQRLALLAPLGINNRAITFPKIKVSKNEIAFAQSQFELFGLDSTKKTILLSIIGSDENKTYPIAYMVELIEMIAASTSVNLILNYIPNQIEIAKEIYNSCNENTKKAIFFDLIGKNIREFIAIMNACDMIIGNDGGAINMAKALNKPSFVIFSPWIDKKGWALLDDGKKHISFHLKDFRPDLFANKTAKMIKNENSSLYKKFKTSYFSEDLKQFLTRHIG